MRPYLLFPQRLINNVAGGTHSLSLSSSSRWTKSQHRYAIHKRSRMVQHLSSPTSWSFINHQSIALPIDVEHHQYLYYYCLAFVAASTTAVAAAINIFYTIPTADDDNEYIEDHTNLPSFNRIVNDESSKILSTSSVRFNDDSSRNGRTQIMATSSSSTITNNATKIKEYDFIIVGYGTAGRSAVETLQQQCPTATIAVIDPFIEPSSFSTKRSNNNGNTIKQANGAIDFYPSSFVTEFDPIGKECVVTCSDASRTTIGNNNTSLSSCVKDCTIKYIHGILIATGCRGAPIPTYLLDDKAQARTYEYRPTILPTQSTSSLNSNNENAGVIPAPPQRPFTSQENLRKFVKRLANTTNETIAVLGSGWDALDIIANIATASSSKRNKANNETDSGTTTHSWIYGSYGPVSHTVPNYLSIEIVKRLQSKRITILDRSLIRYVSFVGDRKAASSPSSVTKKASQHQSQLQVYTAKSYDFLDGKAVPADYVIVAPDVHGARGTGAFPTAHIPSFLQDDKHNHTSWYHTWSSLTTLDDDDDPTSLLSCYKDDGRIAVNTELYACHGVYAAGSVAKYPNGRNGHALVAGSGVVDATNAGYIAAMNMSQKYIHHSRLMSMNDKFLPFGRNIPESSVATSQIYVKDPIPLWRSDVRSTSMNSNEQQLSSLEDIGVVALCVGNCDSESLATHGVWWTNHAAHRRLLALAEMSGEDVNERQQRKKMKQSFKPVYGFGVVFYLDRANKIQGVMTWGLPFYLSDKDRNLDKQFVEKIKSVIKTNGGFRTIESEQDRIEFTRLLGNVSRELIVRAFSKHGSDVGSNHQLDGTFDRLPRPLHRYTDYRPPNVRVVGVLKKNDGQNLGMLGQDLFVRFEQDDIPDNPIPLPLAENLGFAIAKVQAQYDWDVWEQIERRWDENELRARPSKEDPLWIRKGDEGRAMSHREKLAAAYSKAFTGQ